MRNRTIVTLLAVFVSLGFSNPPDEFRNKEYCNKVHDSLMPLQKKLGTVKPGDWLESHMETGQTFAKYLREKPVLARAKRRSIYIQKIGEFSEGQQKIVKLRRHDTKNVVTARPQPSPWRREGACET